MVSYPYKRKILKERRTTMMTNTSVNKWNDQVFYVRIAPNFAPKAYTHQDEQKRCNLGIL